MKRLLSLLLCVAALISLCGCSFTAAVFSEESEYIVTAMGFDEAEGRLNVLLEVLIINSEDTEADKKLELIEGSGETVVTALSEVYKKTAQPLMLSHLGVAVIGNSVTAERFDEICEFCYSEDEITLSMQWVAAESAEKLLSCETVSSIAVGYDIMSMLKQQSERTGHQFKNRFYELESAKEKPLGISALPYFSVEEKSFFDDGLMIFKHSSPILRLDPEQTVFYSIATNTQSAGSVYIDKEEYKIKSAYSKLVFSDTVENPRLYIDLRFEGEKKTEKIENGINELFALSKNIHTDIFGIGNDIYNKKAKEWEKIKQEYQSFYKNLSLTVKIK